MIFSVNVDAKNVPKWQSFIIRDGAESHFLFYGIKLFNQKCTNESFAMCVIENSYTRVTRRFG